MAVISIINGPNLNLLGSREPEIYGRETLADVEELCKLRARAAGHEIAFVQSNAEHVLIEHVHGAREAAAAIIINPGAFSHSSIAIRDALAAFDGAIAEVHISNIHARESFRHHSFVSAVAGAVICGCGIAGYGFAVDWAAARI